MPIAGFPTTLNPTLQVGFTPVFVDVDLDTLGMSPFYLRNFLEEFAVVKSGKTYNKKTGNRIAACVPMHTFGIPCRIQEIAKICSEWNIPLIEDAAEALGSSIDNKKNGSIADSTIFSFCGNKVLTTGEGGAIVTNSKTIHDKINLIRSHGRMDTINYFENNAESNYVQLGYNWRMSSLTASLGISQLNKLEKIIQMRQKNAIYISERLRKFSQIKLPSIPKGYRHIYQMFTIRLQNKTMRDQLHTFLSQKRIFSKVYFTPIHLTEFYQKNFHTKTGLLPKTELISEQVLTLPLYPNMTDEEKNYLIESISEFITLNNDDWKSSGTPLLPTFSGAKSNK